MFARLFGVSVISVEGVEAQHGQLFIVDNNPPMAFEQAHIPGAVNLDPGDYRETDLPPDKHTPIVFYCSGPLCPMAPGAAKRAQRMGYTRVYVLAEGISEWIEKGKPVESAETGEPVIP